MKRRDGDPIAVAIDGKVSQLERVVLVNKSEEGGYDEAWLQRLIHRSPDCLPIGEIEPGFEELVAICMELPTAHGPIDNLLMTESGDIVLVETKLWRNPEARRTVIAQTLDYASGVFAMDYEGLEAAVLRADHNGLKTPASLYALFPDASLDETAFIDAVSRNLRRGRAIVIVVGDGIRSELERMAGLLQSHVGSHMTFALIELAVYKQPKGGHIVLPRTLAQTVMIERGVVDIRDERIVVTPSLARTGKAGVPSTISREKFLESMGALAPELPARLVAFLERLEPLRVYPEFRRTLTLRWDLPSGKRINLGYIQLDGQVWIEALRPPVPQELSHRYLEELATAVGGEVDRPTQGNKWNVKVTGKTPRILQIADRLDSWIVVIERFLDRLRERLAKDDESLG